MFYFVFFFVDVITIAYPLLLDASFSVIWLSILYIVGASIKKYDLIKKVKLKKNIILFILISISTSIITLILKNDYIPKPGANIQYSFMLWYNSPIVILMSICLFFICMKIRIPDKIHTLIHGCSKYTLDLYLIFVNPIVWHYQKSIFVVIPHEYKFLALFAAILIDFVIGYILYLYRTTIFNFLKISKLSVAISERLFTQKKES